MQLKTDGLVIRELNVGESDRILTLLTRRKGIVRASARGARLMKSRISPATALLAHSDFTLFEGREKYIIDEADALDHFMGVRRDLERLALAQYFAELAGVLAPQETEAEIYLRLILNALHFLESGKRPPALVKLAVEMRILTVSGYMPDLVACTSCGAYEDDVMYFDPHTAAITCPNCAGDTAGSFALPHGALAALRHTVYADFDKLFAFSLPDAALARAGAAGERYLLGCLERSFTTLEFYRSLVAEP